MTLIMAGPARWWGDRPSTRPTAGPNRAPPGLAADVGAVIDTGRCPQLTAPNQVAALLARWA